MASNDPDFEKKAADIIGLYLNPPAHAAVFCVDEKTAIQALDRRIRYCRCRWGEQSGEVALFDPTRRITPDSIVTVH